MMSLAVVLLSAVLCVASVGVTESWFSDTDSTEITVETQELRIMYGYGQTADIEWDWSDALTLDSGNGTVVTFTSNYAVTLNFIGGSVNWNGSNGSTSLTISVGDSPEVTIGGTVEVTLGGGGN